MSDILHYKTVTSASGFFHVGVPRSQIIKVSRQGEQKDYAGAFGLAVFNGSNWTFLPGSGNRLTFGSDYPGTTGEVIHIIYKVST